MKSSVQVSNQKGCYLWRRRTSAQPTFPGFAYRRSDQKRNGLGTRLWVTLSYLGIRNPESILLPYWTWERDCSPDLWSDDLICTLPAARMKTLAGALLLLLVAGSRCAEVRRLSAEQLQRSDLWKDDSQRLLLLPEQGWRKKYVTFCSDLHGECVGD